MRAFVTAGSVILSAVVVAAGCGGSPGPEAASMDASASAREAGAEDGGTAESDASSGDSGGGGSSQSDSGSSGSSGDGGDDSDGGTESESGTTGACPTAPPTNLSPCAPGDATCNYEQYHEFCTCGSDLMWTCSIILAMPN